MRKISTRSPKDGVDGRVDLIKLDNSDGLDCPAPDIISFLWPPPMVRCLGDHSAWRLP